MKTKHSRKSIFPAGLLGACKLLCCSMALLQLFLSVNRCNAQEMMSPVADPPDYVVHMPCQYGGQITANTSELDTAPCIDDYGVVDWTIQDYHQWLPYDSTNLPHEVPWTNNGATSADYIPYIGDEDIYGRSEGAGFILSDKTKLKQIKMKWTALGFYGPDDFPYPYSTASSSATFEIDNPNDDNGSGDNGGGSGSGGGCSCSSAKAGSETPAIGTASVGNDAPYVYFNLGPFSTTQTAGSLRLDAEYTSGSLTDPAALYVPYSRTNAGSYVDVVTNGSGVIEQVKAPQGLINIAVIDAYQYEVQMFYATNVTPKSGGLYGTNAAAFDVWTISNPNGPTNNNQLIVTESRVGASTRSFTFTYTNISGTNEWLMTDSGGLRTVATWVTTNFDWTYGTVSNYFTEIRSGTNILKRTQKSYAIIGGLTKLVETVEGLDSNTNITAYVYDGNHHLREIDHPNGNWEQYYFNNPGQLAAKYSAYGVSPPQTPGSPSKEVNYIYTTVVTGDTGFQPNVPRTETVSITGNVISKTYRSVPYPDEVDTYQCADATSTWDDANNLVTKTVTYIDPTDLNTFGKTKWELRPDHTATIYDYQEDTNGVLTNIVMSTGQPYNTIVAPVSIVNGTQTSKAINSWGQVVATTTQVISNSALSTIISRETVTYTDNLQQDHCTVDLAGRTNYYQYSCCGLESTVDPDGVITEYSYDTLRRLVATTTVRGSSSITVSNILDAAGRTLVTQRIGNDGSVITLNQSQYDVLGRVISQTNALNGVTTSTYGVVDSQYCITNVNPDLGTSIETNYSDGRVESITGTAVRPILYQYGTEQDGSSGPWREYALTTKLSSTFGTDEWTKTYNDSFGNRYKTFYASATTPYPVATSYYTNGQLWYQTDPDGVATLYGYNAKGEQVYSVLDTNQNGVIDFSGSDRITFTTNDVIFDNGMNVRRTRTYVWSTSADASNLVSTIERSTDGLKTWNVLWNNGVGVTNSSQIVYNQNTGYRYQTNTAPDGSYSVGTYQYGLLQSLVQKDSTNGQIGAKTYAYDTHFRQNQVTDARTGTTTFTFNNADQINSTTTPSPTQVTTNYFDTMFRNWQTTLPDGTSQTSEFYKTGDVKRQYGSREYPVGYSYDAQGRMITMTNWSSFIYGAGARVTSWAYDGYRGFLTNKTYDGGTTGPGYTYTPAGRLNTRVWARGITTTYTYDNAGGLSAVSYSDGTTPGVSYGYDRRGNQTQIVQGGTVTTSYTYNDQSLVLIETNTGGSLNGISVTNGYDALLRRTNLVALNSGVLTSTRYGYDADSRLKTVSDGTNTATYSYLANSALVSQILFQQNGSNRMMTTKSYDNLNRLTYIGSSNFSGLVLDSHSYAYNTANQRTSVTNVDGTYWVYGYDDLGQVISGAKYWPDGTLVAGQQFGYAFDDIGNRTSTTAGGDQSGANLRYASYSVNHLNQYTSRDVPGAVDIIGSAANTATVTVNDLPTYRRSNYFRAQVPIDNSAPVWQPVTNLAVLNVGTSFIVETNITGNVFLPQNPEMFGYDADGNLTNDGRWIYTWDAENRLIAMTNNPNIPSGAQMGLAFEYDIKGRRTAKSVTTNGVTSTLNCVYDVWNPIATLNSGAVEQSYAWGSDLSGSLQGAGGVGGLIFERISGVQTSYCTYDGNGNVNALVDSASGQMSGEYEYGVFGEVIRATGQIANANPFRFSTKYYDDQTGLAYYGHRYLNAATGRWLNRDPIEELGGLNVYCFVGNKILGLIDILGLGTWTISVDNSSFHGVDERPVINATYTEDADEKKCCNRFRIIRAASGALSSNTNDDPNGGYSVPGPGTGSSTPDQPGGTGGWGPQIIPLTFHFKWTAVCIDGCCKGKILSVKKLDYSLWWYTGTLNPPPPSPPPYRPPGTGPWGPPLGY